jgi:hypothetical protein
MNQEHIQQQPAADAYVIGGPSEFAEDVSPSKGWKEDLDSDGNTKRNELGMPEYRKDTFNNPSKSPGVSPSRQATVADVHAKAKVATKVARRMLPRTASEQVIEDQALNLMDLELPSLRATLARLAQDESEDEDEDEDEDEGQQKEAADEDDDDDEDEDDDKPQAKQAKELPPEFLENIKKKKDEAKDKDDGDDKKSQSKEARRRLKAQQQDDDDDDDEGQAKQARHLKAQQQDDDDEPKEQSKEPSKEARRLKAQQQDDDDEDEEGQAKQARRMKAQQDDADDDDDKPKEQSKEARRRLKAQQQDDDDADEKKVGKAAYKLIKQAATALLKMPVASRMAAFRVALPSLAKAASQQLNQTGQGQDQVQSQVQQLVQNAMQQQLSQDQQQKQLGLGQQQLSQGQQQPSQGQQQLSQGFGPDAFADDELVDQMLQEPGDDFSEQSIQMDVPDMDLGFQEEDPALQAIFASDSELQSALEAKALESGRAPTARTRTASTRTVGTRPSAGVSLLGGGSGSAPSSGAEEINRLASMWATSPDVSGVFRT